ncbi:amino acid transporter [Rufibacter radiotolerans]|uniref:Amino acid transporter n=1 Tax=Rufibacter radiotolerans TaxID=1379910 RepID=A0A0H4VPV8_9BACT|nr:peptide MFS transporter [Rufibacter radiotolerans]AKQ47343.1 amino acid transporter [Rufibacter radiotolerans]
MSEPAAKHPRGLYFLFFSEMWERFGYYLMVGIFFLYMTDAQKGGMELDKGTASDIYGTFIALVFLTPFLGGLLADRVLGYRLSISLGGILMGIGYCGLAIKGDTAFYVSLGLIILGNGFFKPNISTLLGNLYSKPEYLPQKDAGYNIFYMGINIGAMVCNFVAAYMRNNYGWGYAFVAAGIGMFIGVLVFWMGNKEYREADVRKPVQANDMSLGKIFGIVLLPAVLCGIASWFLIPGNVFGSDSTDAFLFGALPIVFFYVSLYAKASAEDKRPIAALLAIFGVVVVFWAVFKQNGTALTTWAESYTDRTMPAVIAKPAETLGMVQRVDTEPKTVPAYDPMFRTTTDADGKVVTKQGVDPYLNNLEKGFWPKAGESLALISTELFQSVNPFFVVILTPVVVSFFGFLSRRGKEPSTPAKIGWGLFITALSTLVMVGAVYASDNGTEKSAGWWLVGTYAVVTVGELFLSPMGLSLVSKLSPPRLTALLMGGWFLATSIGNKLSGVLASMWDRYDNKAFFFLLNFAVTLAAAGAIFMMIKWLRGIVEEHTRRA